MTRRDDTPDWDRPPEEESWADLPLGGDAREEATPARSTTTGLLWGDPEEAEAAETREAGFETASPTATPRGGGPRGGLSRFAWSAVLLLALAVALGLGVFAGYRLREAPERPREPVARVELGAPEAGGGTSGAGRTGAGADGSGEESGGAAAARDEEGGERSGSIDGAGGDAAGASGKEERPRRSGDGGARSGPRERSGGAGTPAPGGEEPRTRRAAAEDGSAGSPPAASEAIPGTGHEAPPPPPPPPAPPRLSAERLAFEAVSLVPGTPAASETVSLENPRATPLPVRASLAGGTAGFRLVRDGCSGSLPPGASCTVEVAFEPRAEGAAEAELVLSWGSGGAGAGERRVALSATGVAPRLEVVPGRLEFGEQRTGRAGRPLGAALASRGSAPLVLEGVELSGPDRDAFRLALRDGCRTEMPGGSRCELEVVFLPTRPGRHEASAAVASNALAGTDRDGERLVLTGTGIAPRLTVGGERLDFGRVRVSERARRGLVLGNAGTAPLEIEALTVSGGRDGEFSVVGPCGGAVLEPGGSCRAAVEFAPQGAPGRRGARLVVEPAEGDGETVPVELVAAALPAPAPAIRLSPVRVRFGEEPVGRRSPILTLAVENPGTAPLHLGAPRLVGPDAGDFQVVPGTCDGIPFVAPGGSCTLGLRFLPSSPGPRRAGLALPHDAEDGERRAVLEGTGL